MNTSGAIQFTLKTYVKCGKEASSALFYNWLLIVGSVLAYFLFKVAYGLFVPLGWGGGFLVGFVQIVLVTYYYGWLSDAIQRERVKFQNFYLLDYNLFFQIISVAFVLWIAQMLVGSLTAGMDAEKISLFVQLGIVIIFNAIPETLYIHRYESLHALSYSANFTRENWIEWFIPFVIILAPLLYLSPSLALVELSRSMELLPALLVVQAWDFAANFYGSVLFLLGILVANWFMLFRGFLFLELESGTQRQRMYRSGLN